MQDWQQRIIEYRLTSTRKRTKAADSLAKKLVQDICAGMPIDGLDDTKKADLYQMLADIVTLAIGRDEAAFPLLQAIHLILTGTPLKRPRQFEQTFNAKAENVANLLDPLQRYVLDEIRTTRHCNRELRLSWIMYFAASHSGLCFEEGLQALLNCLNQPKKPFFKAGAYLGLPLSYQRSNHHTNKEVDECRVTQRLFFPEPITLAAIKGFLTLSQNERSQQTTDRTPSFYLNSLIERSPVADKLKQFKTKHILQGMALWFANQPGEPKPVFLRAYANGDLPSASTSLNCLAALANKSCRPANLTSLESTIHRSKQKTNRKERRAYARDNSFLTALRKACATQTENGMKRTLYEVRLALKQLAVSWDDLNIAEEVLLEWVISQLGPQGGWNSPSTALRNLSVLAATWLNVCGSIDLTTLDVGDMNEIYEEIVEQKQREDLKIIDAVRQVLLFAHGNFDIALPDSLQGLKRQAPHVRNAIISETHFQRLRADIQQLFKGETADIKEVLDLMLLLARRLGLRPGEIVKLKLVDLTPSDGGFVIIRSNEYGNNKRPSSYRIIELRPLLLDSEQKAFWRYYQRRCDRVAGNFDRLLFSVEPQHDVPFSISTISEPVSLLLSQYLGEPVPLYQLRHSALSILQIVRFGSDEAILALTPYTVQQAMQIRGMLNNGEDQDQLFQIAGVAGHLSPLMSVTTYLHHTDLILYERATGSAHQYVLEIWQKLCGIRPSTLNRWLKEQGLSEADSCGLTARAIKEFIHTQMLPHTENLRMTKQVTTPVVTQALPNRHLTPILCHQILVSFDNGKSTEEVADLLTVDTLTVGAVVEAAKSIATAPAYQTSRGKSRLYPDKFNALAPPKVGLQVEARELRLFLHSMEKSLHVERVRWQDSAHYVLSNMVEGHSYLPFSNPDQLKTLIELCRDIVPVNRWELEIVPLAGEQNISKEWHCDNKIKITLSKARVKNTTLYPKGLANLYFLVPGKDKNNAAWLKRKGFSRYSSNLFKRAMHIVAIYLKAQQAIEAARPTKPERSVEINAQPQAPVQMQQLGLF